MEKVELLIVYSSYSKNAIELAEIIKKRCTQKRLTVTTLDRDNPIEIDSTVFSFALSLGGDGTFLFTARFFIHNPIPILPIHLGTLGFMAEITPDSWEEALNSLLEGNVNMSYRKIMRSDVVFPESTKAESFFAINEFSITSGEISNIIHLQIEVDGAKVSDFKGDGLIFATPTGSTAYSLAAGGPIIFPNIEGFIMTPICPFSLTFRPIIFPENEKIVIKVLANQRTPIILTIDGQKKIKLLEDTKLAFTGSKKSIGVVVPKDFNFFYGVKQKLGWSGVTNA